jgi:hypothetical protein
VLDTGQIAFTPGLVAKTEFQKTVEFSIQIRPDIAFLIINHFIETLNRLPENSRMQYGIPNNLRVIQPIQPSVSR